MSKLVDEIKLHEILGVKSQPQNDNRYLKLTGGTLTGNLLFTDNTLDIGASGATRPRTGYFGTSVVTPLIIGTNIKPSADSTTAIQLQNAAGTNILNVDTTNGRVGIGTTSPTQALTLGSTAKIGWDNGSGTADVFLYRYDATSLETNNEIRIRSDGGTAALFGVNNTNQLARAFASDRPTDTYNLFQIMVDGSMRWGPGNATTDAFLNRSAAGEMTFDNDLVVKTIYGRYDATYPTSGKGYFALKTNNVSGTSGGLTIQTELNGTLYDKMAINYLGNVGIGTTAPVEKLEVNGGNIKIAGTNFPMLNIVSYASAQTWLIPYNMMYRSGGTQASPSATLANYGLGRFGWRGHTGTAFDVNDTAYIDVTADSDFTTSNSETHMSFGTTPNGSLSALERMRITSGGNVGIGTTNPLAKLEVNGNIRIADNSAYYLNKRADSASTIIQTSRSDGSQTGLLKTNGWGGFSFVGDGSNGLAVGYDLPASQTGMIINGNVGIGTTGPDKKLEINLGTADALRWVYNDANGGATTYCDVTISSVGLTAFTGAGSAPSFAFANPIIESTDTLTGAGAVSVTKTTTKYTTAGVGDALTLANGTDGQIKRIILDVLASAGHTAILTPTTKTGFTTVTFSVAGQSVSLQYVTTRGWIVVGSFGVVTA